MTAKINVSKLGLFTVLPIAFVANVQAKNPQDSGLNISGVLNGYYQNSEKVLSEKAEGFGLGETELALSGAVDNAFYGKLTSVIESADGDTEFEIEEAFIQTQALPNGFSVRAGRFMSDIGYLNNQHLHTDAFVDRPAAYRAFLGSHYFDDGVRIDYIAPTDIYWAIGIEAFKGQKLQAEELKGEAKSVGAYTFYNKFGGDIGNSSSWQLGLSYLRNENGQAFAAEHHDDEADHDEHEDHHNDEHEGEHDHEEQAGHNHGASFTGKNLFSADVVYKWAPQGNYKYQHLTLSGEYFRLTDIFLAEEIEHQSELDKDHQAWYISGVYQFSPQWSTGVRYGRIDTYHLHEEVLESASLKETELQLSYHHSHFSTIRLQYTHQDGTEMFLPTNENSITLQFIMTLGAHSAHQF
ncbi:hypothetical protein D5R81_11545 [Parashewanella spongiae]|uniref:Porin n=1 Tax=Parashewanella spongiae TaxID=342950 RepID=A0A3A6TPV0_9GAMM|nr:hypothetical protein [Parashewanella spongiae]MCL1079437.1 hypothetical protein [Parashewanella spongiae]RJY13203.1 hypothetical protein D5R81_11545 [Parashewanella spongiae]